MRPRIEYSNKQWDNGTSRRCKVCVGNGTPVDHGSDKYGQLPAPPKTGIREAQALASKQVIWTEMLAQVEEMLGHGKDVLQELYYKNGNSNRALVVGSTVGRGSSSASSLSEISCKDRVKPKTGARDAFSTTKV